MPANITGTHLRCYAVEDKNSQNELGRFGEWAAEANFESVSDALSQCKHKDRHRKLEPVLKELKYKARSFHLQEKTNANI
jgi:hypothetical protein